jgi:hypothetical protein
MFGIGMGPSGHEIGDRNALNQIGGFATQTGEGLLSQSSNFMSALMSGDQSKIAQVLAPQFNAIQKQAGQRKATTGQFGTRGGGTDAAMQAVDDSTRAQTNDMVSNLTGGAVSGGASLGSGLLNTGADVSQAVFGEDQTMHDQSMQQLNDLAGSIAQTVAGGIGGFVNAPAGASSMGGAIKGIFGVK